MSRGLHTSVLMPEKRGFPRMLFPHSLPARLTTPQAATSPEAGPSIRATKLSRVGIAGTSLVLDKLGLRDSATSGRRKSGRLSSRHRCESPERNGLEEATARVLVRRNEEQ